MGTSCKKIHICEKIRKKIRKKIQEDTFNDTVSTPYGKANSSLRPDSFLKSLVILKIFALAALVQKFLRMTSDFKKLFTGPGKNYIVPPFLPPSLCLSRFLDSGVETVRGNGTKFSGWIDPSGGRVLLHFSRVRDAHSTWHVPPRKDLHKFVRASTGQIRDIADSKLAGHTYTTPTCVLLWLPFLWGAGCTRQDRKTFLTWGPRVHRNFELERCTARLWEFLSSRHYNHQNCCWCNKSVSSTITTWSQPNFTSRVAKNNSCSLKINGAYQTRQTHTLNATSALLFSTSQRHFSTCKNTGWEFPFIH